MIVKTQLCVDITKLARKLGAIELFVSQGCAIIPVYYSFTLNIIIASSILIIAGAALTTLDLLLFVCS